MTDELHLDWETAADVDLTKVGLDVYTSPTSNPRVLMGAYRINTSRIQHWEAHKRKIPPELKEALEDPEVEKWAFNAQFERIVAKRVLGLRITRKNWRCAQVLAYSQSFMGGLGDVGAQIGLPLDLQKMKDGKRLIRRFSIPQKVTKNQPNVWRNWITDPEEWDIFGQYNIQDVVTEEGIIYRLRKFPFPDIEWEFYELDQEINDRGIPADIDFIHNVIWMSNRRKKELITQMSEITGCDNPNSVKQLLPWLHTNGYYFNDLRKESVKKQLEIDCGGGDTPINDDDPDLIKVLKYRQWAARTSVSKAVTALRSMGDDNRLRYLYQFAGASRTNRFAGRTVQPQNMMVTPKVLDPEESDEKLTTVTNMIREGDYDGFLLTMDEPMRAFTGCMRSMFRVGNDEEEEFQVADLKSIESAVIAWVTNCARLLGVFRSGKDPYKDFGTEFYKKAYDDITRIERGICKPPALGCGFRLSGGQILRDGTKTGLLAYAENMGVQMTLEEANKAVTVYRTTYPEIPEFWKDCEKAIYHVLTTKSSKKLGFLKFHWMKPYLAIELPSGRNIYYYKPRLEKREIYTGRIKKAISKGEAYWDSEPASFGVLKGEEYEYEETYFRRVFTYMGKHQKTQQWTRLDGHGGVTTENVVQAIARDVLREKLMRMKQENFKIVMHSHDEGGAEGRKNANRLNLQLVLDIFKEPISWAPGLPLGASGWAGAFYRK
jgi:Casjensviridae DNA polymerase